MSYVQEVAAVWHADSTSNSSSTATIGNCLTYRTRAKLTEEFIFVPLGLTDKLTFHVNKKTPCHCKLLMY